MEEITLTLPELIAQILLNAPNFAGLILTIIILLRNSAIEREEKNNEIERLQGHNDRLMMWCRNDESPPME